MDPVSPNEHQSVAAHRGDGPEAVGYDISRHGKVEAQEEHGEIHAKQTEIDGVKSEGEILCRTSDDFMCKPCNPVGVEAAEADVEEEAEPQRVVTDPGQPTQDEIDEHEANHYPFRPWCAACVKGRAKDAPSRKVTGPFAEQVLPRVRMDYAFLTEEVEQKAGEHGEEETTTAGETLTCALMHESQNKSVWSYAVAHKGSREDWLIEQVLEDLETVGLRNDRVVLKSDQENAMQDVMREVQKQRQADFGTALDTSRVGDSDSNGTIEAAIQQFEGMARTIRFSMEEKLKCKLKLSDPLMVWLVRHAGHVLTRCSVKPSGRTA